MSQSVQRQLGFHSRASGALAVFPTTRVDYSGVDCPKRSRDSYPSPDPRTPNKPKIELDDELGLEIFLKDETVLSPNRFISSDQLKHSNNNALVILIKRMENDRRDIEQFEMDLLKNRVRDKFKMHFFTMLATKNLLLVPLIKKSFEKDQLFLKEFDFMLKKHRDLSEKLRVNNQRSAFKTWQIFNESGCSFKEKNRALQKWHSVCVQKKCQQNQLEQVDSFKRNTRLLTQSFRRLKDYTGARRYQDSHQKIAINCYKTNATQKAWGRLTENKLCCKKVEQLCSIVSNRNKQISFILWNQSIKDQKAITEIMKEIKNICDEFEKNNDPDFSCLKEKVLQSLYLMPEISRAILESSLNLENTLSVVQDLKNTFVEEQVQDKLDSIIDEISQKISEI